MFFFFLLIPFCCLTKRFIGRSSSHSSEFVSLLSVVGLDIQDEMGRHEVGHIENSMKIPLNQGDGCRFEGEFSINKVRSHLRVREA